MFFYVQESEHSKWEPVFESEQARLEVVKKQIPMVSVLAVKEVVQEEDDRHSHAYKGPLYFDIDNSDLEVSIKSGQQMIQKLKDKGATGYSIFLSGKKGLHIIVPQESFCKPRATKLLPLVYKEMAVEMYVTGLDFAVYNCGKPRLWRSPNVKRKDNGKYKVQISEEDLESLTVEKYAELTSHPRPEIAVEKGAMSIKLQSLYEDCRHRVLNHQRRTDSIKFVPEEEVAQTLVKAREKGHKVPQCIQNLIEKGDTQPGSTFNQACIQFASYAVKAGMAKADWMPLAEEMATNVKSNTYNNKQKRYDELKKMVAYVASSTTYGFSKEALFSVSKPCGDCPVCNGDVEDGKVVLGSEHEADLGIVDTPKGYQLQFGKSVKEITSFSLDVTSKFVEESEDGENYRSGVKGIIKVNGHRRDTVVLTEESWNSSAAFKSAIAGKSNHVFLGNDQDLQRLKNYVLRKEEELPTDNYVQKAGVQKYSVNGRTILVYVEPGFSVTSTKEQGTHHIVNKLAVEPHIKDAKYPKPTTEYKAMLDNLLNMNSPEAISLLLGWIFAAHLRTQINMRSNQFPSLSVWGNAGSGKTALTSLAMGLHGVDHIFGSSPTSCQGTTPWALSNICSSTHTTPIILEELNQNMMSHTNYNHTMAIIKEGWNAGTHSRGTTKSARAGGKKVMGAHVEQCQLTSPILMVSEQMINFSDAIRQRRVSVNLTRSGRERQGVEESYYYVLDNATLLTDFARALVWESLSTTPDWVMEQINEAGCLIPKEIGTRPRFSMQVVVAGWKFFSKTLLSIGFAKDYVLELEGQMINAAKSTVKVHSGNSAIVMMSTDVVEVLKTFSSQADMSDFEEIHHTLKNGMHYFRMGDSLWLDMTSCFVNYQHWMKGLGNRPLISSQADMEMLISQEDFYDGIEMHPEVQDGHKPLIKLDIEKLAKRGVNVRCFKAEF